MTSESASPPAPLSPRGPAAAPVLSGAPGPDAPASRALRLLARHPFAVLFAVVLVQAIPTLYSREYWAFDEVRHASVLRELVDHGHWLSLHMNGQTYPDKPPVYFWLVALASRVLSTDGPAAFFLVSAFGGFVFLTGTYVLARVTLAKGRPTLALLAPLLATATPMYQLLLRTTRMDLLFAGVIVWAVALLWRGLARERPNGGVVLGLLLSGLATVVKGPLGLGFPLAGLLAWCLLTRRGRRLFRWDVGLGLAAALAPVTLWLAALASLEGPGYVRELLTGQVVGRALAGHGHGYGPWFYLAVLPAAVMPWPILLVAAPWRRLRDRRVWDAFRPQARDDRDGRIFLAATFLAGFVVLSAARSKLVIYVMPLLGPLAVLAADWISRLPAARERRAGTALGAGALLASCAAALGNAFVPFPQVRLHGLLPLALVFAGTGALVFAFRRRAVEVTVLGLLVANTLVAALVVPSLDPVMSPRAEAEAMRRLADRGWSPLMFRAYPGAFTYYAGRTLPETRDLDALRAYLHDHEKVVVATPRHYLERFPDELGGLTVVDERRIEGAPFVLLARPSPPEVPRR